jgi:vesicle coat complex subunit
MSLTLLSASRMASSISLPAAALTATGLLVEALRVLSSPDIDVRRKALNLAMEMVSSKNVEEIIMQ